MTTLSDPTPDPHRSRGQDIYIKELDMTLSDIHPYAYGVLVGNDNPNLQPGKFVEHFKEMLSAPDADRWKIRVNAARLFFEHHDSGGECSILQILARFPEFMQGIEAPPDRSLARYSLSLLLGRCFERLYSGLPSRDPSRPVKDFIEVAFSVVLAARSRSTEETKIDCDHLLGSLCSSANQYRGVFSEQARQSLLAPLMNHALQGRFSRADLTFLYSHWEQLAKNHTNSGLEAALQMGKIELLKHGLACLNSLFFSRMVTPSEEQFRQDELLRNAVETAVLGLIESDFWNDPLEELRRKKFGSANVYVKGDLGSDIPIIPFNISSGPDEQGEACVKVLSAIANSGQKNWIFEAYEGYVTSAIRELENFSLSLSNSEFMQLLDRYINSGPNSSSLLSFLGCQGTAREDSMIRKIQDWCRWIGAIRDEMAIKSGGKSFVRVETHVHPGSLLVEEDPSFLFVHRDIGNHKIDSSSLTNISVTILSPDQTVSNFSLGSSMAHAVSTAARKTFLADGTIIGLDGDEFAERFVDAVAHSAGPDIARLVRYARECASGLSDFLIYEYHKKGGTDGPRTRSNIPSPSGTVPIG